MAIIFSHCTPQIELKGNFKHFVCTENCKHIFSKKHFSVNVSMFLCVLCFNVSKKH